MRKLLLSFFALGALAGPAVAQSFEGNWACKVDGRNAGLLTIYGPSYGYASATTGSTASGVGSVSGFTDGVQFNDGNLRVNAGIEAGRLVPDATTGVAMQLESATQIVLLCTPL